MKLVRELAQHALEHHPDRAATVLERLDEAETIRLLERGSLESASAVLERLSPHYATAVLRGLKRERAARMLDALPVDVAVRVVRRADGGLQEALLALVDPNRARSIRSVLGFREGSAGALMDPDVLALPSDLSVREALRRVRKDPNLARYNLYVVDQAQRLVGALNLRELLLARGRLSLSDLMTRDPHRVLATADRATVLAHPGWKEVHALPVVDEANAFLGAIRYRVLRQLEVELLASRSGDLETSAAFGQVIAAGARGVLDAFSGAAELEFGRGTSGAEKRS